jgi:hypothetical protein
MKNILAITLGTRDVQIKISNIQHDAFFYDQKTIYHNSYPEIKLEGYIPEGFEDTFCLKTPRLSGKIIHDNSFFKPLLHFPLIDPVLKFLKDKNITAVFILYTDQESEYSKGLVKEKDYRNDTLYFSSIVSNHIKQVFQLDYVDEYPVHEEVTNIDYLYTHFEKEGRKLFEIDVEEIDKIYLLPQGGIDQINQAFTLKLIQKFGGKVLQIQQAENKQPKVLNFPELFLDDLNKQKILKHLEDYDFALIDESLTNNNAIIKYAYYATNKLRLDYAKNEAIQIEGDLKEADDSFIRCKDTYLQAKMYFKRKDIANYLIKLFTILENLYKSKCEPILGSTDEYYSNRFNKPELVNHKWINKLNDVDGLLNFLETRYFDEKKKKPLFINNPHRLLFKFSYNFFVTHKLITDSSTIANNLNHVNNTLELLKDERNQIVHNLYPVSKEIVLSNMPSSFSFEELNKRLDQIFNIKNGFGIYSAIKAKILENL